MKKQLSKLEKDKFSKAQELSKRGDVLGVLNIMKDLVEANPRSAVFSAVLANTYWDIGELDTAEKEFRKAVQLAPESEKISLGLFHCLWDQKKKDAAFEEMKRFMVIADSEGYRTIVNRINDDDKSKVNHDG